MLLGTVILLALITPKSSFSSFPLSPLFPLIFRPLYANTHWHPPHTHTICHITRPARPWISGRASDLWCIYFGWEGRIWFNFCLFGFILPLVLMRCWNWHHFPIRTPTVRVGVLNRIPLLYSFFFIYSSALKLKFKKASYIFYRSSNIPAVGILFT